MYVHTNEVGNGRERTVYLVPGITVRTLAYTTYMYTTSVYHNNWFTAHAVHIRPEVGTLHIGPEVGTTPPPSFLCT